MRETYSQPLARDAMAYVLAGGRGSRLKELTDNRAKPAVYFGGKSRIIDFALSNAINSGIRRIGVATQYKAHSLIRHMQRAWNFMRPERNESFDILPASQRVSEDHWYEGTADAVFQNIDIIASYAPKYMVILAGDHIYKMDYELMLRQHVESGADVTIGCLVVPRMEATGFGVMAVDKTDSITDFIEKPANPPGIPGNEEMALASMGIYVFETKFLFQMLQEDADDPNSSRDFGNDIIPKIVKNGKAVAHRFTNSCIRAAEEIEEYWRDVGTLDAYFEANLDLTDVVPKLNMYDRDWPIWTDQIIAAPAKFVHDVDQPGLHRLGSRRQAQPVVYRRKDGLVLLVRGSRHPALLQHRPWRAAQPRDPRFRRAHPRRPRRRRRPDPRCQALPPHRRRGLPHQQGDDRAAEVRVPT